MSETKLAHLSPLNHPSSKQMFETGCDFGADGGQTTDGFGLLGEEQLLLLVLLLVRGCLCGKSAHHRVSQVQ